MSRTLILSSLSLFPLYFLSTVGVGIYPFKFVSPHNSRCFLIGDICTLSDVRVRALCCELSGALDSAPSSSSVSQVASDTPQCEWRGTRHTPPLQMNRDTRSLHFCHKEHSECLAKPSVRTLQNCHDTWPLAPRGIVRTALWWCSSHFCLLCHLWCLLPLSGVWSEHQNCSLHLFPVRQCRPWPCCMCVWWSCNKPASHPGCVPASRPVFLEFAVATWQHCSGAKWILKMNEQCTVHLF